MFPQSPQNNTMTPGITQDLHSQVHNIHLTLTRYIYMYQSCLAKVAEICSLKRVLGSKLMQKSQRVFFYSMHSPTWHLHYTL